MEAELAEKHRNNEILQVRVHPTHLDLDARQAVFKGRWRSSSAHINNDKTAVSDF
jgi:hypothetical protein